MTSQLLPPQITLLTGSDYATIAEIAVAAFFLVLAAALLARYRVASQRMNESADVGKELVQTLEGELKRQDAKIAELMVMVDAIQSRYQAAPKPEQQPPTPSVTPARPEPPSRPADVAQQPPPQPQVTAPQQPQPQVTAPQPQVTEQKVPTDRVILRLLTEGPRTAPQLKDVLGLSREHTARIMKTLFDRGFVAREDVNKPFVYRITDEGTRYLSVSSASAR